MKKFIVVALVCIQFVCSCTEITKNLMGQKILIVPDNPTDEGQTFFENFELENIVPVETTDDYLVTYPNKIVRYRDKLIFKTSTGYIFVVNIETGKVEGFINRKGNGPGEYHNISDITVDERTGEIIVYNDYNKLMFFDMNGKFLREEKLNFRSSNMVYYDGKLLLNERGEGTSVYPYEFYIYDIDKKTVNKFGDSTRVDFNVKMFQHLVKSKNIWCVAALDYNLYKWNDGKFEIPYSLKVKNPITERLRAKNDADFSGFLREVHEGKIIYGFGVPVETDRFILLISNLYCLIMINKETSEITCSNILKDEKQLGLSSLYSFISIDGDENRVMFAVFADTWLREVTAHPERIAPKWKEKISKMEIVEDSNPILLIYKEKKVE